MMKKLVIAAAVVAASGLAAVSAKANPIYLGYSLNGGAITAFPGSPTSAGTASVTGDTTDVPGFTISMSATGSPVVAMPNFFSNTVSVQSNLSGSNTLVLYASETNVTAITGGFTSSFNNNGDSTTSLIETTYKDMTNTAFGTARTLSTATLSPGTTSNGNVAAFGTSTLYALTESYAINFTASGQIVDATIGVTGVPTTVPEPASMALLGAGLVGIGMIRRRSRKS